MIATGAILFATTAIASISAPGNITNTDTNGSVALSWDSDATATGYNVYKNNQYLTTVAQSNYEETLATDEVATYYVVAFASNPDSSGPDIYSPRSEQVTLPASAVPTDTTIAVTLWKKMVRALCPCGETHPLMTAR